MAGHPPGYAPLVSGSVSKALSVVSLVSTYAAGFLGIPVVLAVGPALAMGARMYLGELEPSAPQLVWPMYTTIGLALLPIPAVVTRRWPLAVALAVPFAVLPYVHLYRLYLAAAPRG